jgi:hypothetical protein
VILLLFLSFCICNVFCTESLLTPFFLPNDDWFNTILSFYIEPDEPQIALVPKKKEGSNEWIKEEDTVISISLIAKLCRFRLVCKDFQAWVDNLLKSFPFVCCDNKIMPCIPFAPQVPITRIQLTAPNEYDIFLNLYFKTKLNKASEDYSNGDDYLYLNWHYTVTFKEKSLIKPILDTYLKNKDFLYNLCNDDEQGPGSLRNDLALIDKLTTELLKEHDQTKHYKCFIKHGKNLSLYFPPQYNVLLFLLKRLYDDDAICHERYIASTIFPSRPFIKNPYIHITIPDPLNAFSLKHLQNRPYYAFIENSSIICPVLMNNILALHKILAKLKKSDAEFFEITLIEKFIQKNLLIKYFLDLCMKNHSTFSELQKEEINRCANILNQQYRDFFNILFKISNPDNQISQWLWKRISESMHYLLSINQKISVDKLFTSIKVITHLQSSTSKKISPALQKILFYSQSKIFNILSLHPSDKEKLPRTIIITSIETYIYRLHNFFNYDHFGKDYNLLYLPNDHQRETLDLLKKECKKTMELLTLRLNQKQAVTRLFSTYNKEREEIINRQNIVNHKSNILTWIIEQFTAIKKICIYFACRLFKTITQKFSY